MVECLYFLADSLGITHTLKEDIGSFLISALYHCKHKFTRMVVYGNVYNLPRNNSRTTMGPKAGKSRRLSYFNHQHSQSSLYNLPLFPMQQ